MCNYEDILFQEVNGKQPKDVKSDIEIFLKRKTQELEMLVAGKGNTVIINVAKDFGAAIAARNRLLNAYSGEAFRDDCLIPAYHKVKSEEKALIVNFNGVLGCPPSFYDEVFIEPLREGCKFFQNMDEKIDYLNRVYILYYIDSRGNPSEYAKDTVLKIYSEMYKACKTPRNNN